MNTKQILIVGGGFGGIACALALEKKNIPGIEITLVSDKSHFEYHAALYRVVTGKSPLEVCIPIREIFTKKHITFVVDTIEDIDITNKTAVGISKSRYRFDYLVVALGSETAYFNIPGLKEFSFGFKSIPEALRLKSHLHTLFQTCTISSEDQEEDLCRMHFVVVGAGASGVELAGELAVYTKMLAKHHGVDESFITIDLIEGAPRILPALPLRVSDKISTRLHNLGVNIFTNRPMIKENIEEVMVRGVTLKTETVVWTAGIKPNALYQRIKGFVFDKKGRVLVDEYLHAQGFNDVFVIGDGAATPYSGMAQTAIYDGKIVAKNVINGLTNNLLESYQPRKTYYALPVGPGWAATLIGSLTLYGKLGWFFRRLADIRYFISILPLPKALRAFRNGETLCESCEVCIPETTS